jgi:predicted ArsR family transcriptional regulator
MTQPATLNGQVIGQAERATRAVLEVLLAETDTAFTDWVTLNLVATHDDVIIDSLVEQLVTGLRITDSQARTSIDDLVRTGLITASGTARLTTDGRARYQRISDGIAQITQRLYHDLPHDDLVVARRVLETLTERARAELANAS